MSPAQVHLALTHFPVVGVVFAAALLVAAIWRQKPELRQAALVMLVVCAAFAIPVFFSGEGAEEIVEHRAGVSEDLIGQHERLAKFAFGAMEALGVAALLGLLVAKVRDARAYAPAMLIATILMCGLMMQTAHLGGAIRHDEIRGGAANGATPEGGH